MPGVSVREAGPADHPVLERLWLMFRHDMSGFRGQLPRPDGTFRSERLQAAFGDPDWAPYLLARGESPVGLALVRGLRAHARVLSGFFVVRGARRSGIGLHAAQQVTARHPGHWEVAFQDENMAAVRFWRRAAAEIAGAGWTEERRPVPGQPGLPPDVWISFDVPADLAGLRRPGRAGDNRPMGTIERLMPPLNTDERSTLESWLDFHRSTLTMKCAGLDDEQAAAASVPPSGFTLTGLVQHMAEVERNWFRRVFAGEQAPPIYDPRADPDAPDGGFELAEGATLDDALATWRTEITRARELCAGHTLADTGRFMGREVSLRWIYVHMIEEYARHNGHADLLRERIDGTTGV